ncbi:fragile X mental retardation 1 neighbor protein isoform X2 [Alligator sinensis]|nr:fragile X mental retardation 1 neighbor protein isoform X2 [Alligator sinensis]
MMQMATGNQFLGSGIFLLYHIISPSFASPTQHVLKRSEVAPSKPKMKLEDISEALLNFFNPVTCRPKEDQALVACPAGENINKTTCLENKCCRSSKGRSALSCYIPLQDVLVPTLYEDQTKKWRKLRRSRERGVKTLVVFY